MMNDDDGDDDDDDDEDDDDDDDGDDDEDEGRRQCAPLFLNYFCGPKSPFASSWILNVSI